MAGIIEQTLQETDQQEIKHYFDSAKLFLKTFVDERFKPLSIRSDEMHSINLFKNVVNLSEIYLARYNTIDIVPLYYVQAAYNIGSYEYEANFRTMALEYFEKILIYVENILIKINQYSLTEDQQDIIIQILYYYVFAAIHSGDIDKDFTLKKDEHKFVYIEYYKKAINKFDLLIQNGYPEDMRFPNDTKIIEKIRSEVDQHELEQRSMLSNIDESNEYNVSKGGAKRRHKKKKRNTRRNKKKSQKRIKRKRNTRRKK